MSDAGELLRRKHTTFRTWRKFEIKNIMFVTKWLTIVSLFNFYILCCIMGKQVCYMGVRDVNSIHQCSCMLIFSKKSGSVCVLRHSYQDG
jgi:hypothetical protein